MGDVISFRPRAQEPGPGADQAEPRSVVDSLDLARLRRSIARLEAVRPEIAASGHNLEVSVDRLRTQAERLRRRSRLSRDIESAADQLGAVIASGDLAAAERLVPEFEALARAVATADDAGSEAGEGAVRAARAVDDQR